MKKILFICFLFISSLVIGKPHEKKLDLPKSFFSDMLSVNELTIFKKVLYKALEKSLHGSRDWKCVYLQGVKNIVFP